jgi:hypothetical protein
MRNFDGDIITLHSSDPLAENVAMRLVPALEFLAQMGYGDSATLGSIKQDVQKALERRKARIARDYPKTLGSELDGILDMGERRKFYKWLEEMELMERTTRYGSSNWKEPTEHAVRFGFARKFESDVVQAKMEAYNIQGEPPASCRGLLFFALRNTFQSVRNTSTTRS